MDTSKYIHKKPTLVFIFNRLFLLILNQVSLPISEDFRICGQAMRNATRMLWFSSGVAGKNKKTKLKSGDIRKKHTVGKTMDMSKRLQFCLVLPKPLL